MIRRILRTLFDHTGVILYKRPRYNGRASFSIDGLHYGFTLPQSNYAPWEGDVAFQSIHREIRGHTLVDVYRCHELWQLVEKVQQLDPAAAILEVGVWRGGTAAVMARRLLDLKSPATLYLADTFAGVAKAGANDAFYTGGEHHDTSQDTVEGLIKRTSAYPSTRVLKGIFPDETGGLIHAGQKFSLCHIDVDVYDSAKGVLDWVWPRLIPGGVVVFDDYGFHYCTGVAKLVEEYRRLDDRHVIHNLNGHALMIRVR